MRRNRRHMTAACAERCCSGAAALHALKRAHAAAAAGRRNSCARERVCSATAVSDAAPDAAGCAERQLRGRRARAAAALSSSPLAAMPLLAFVLVLLSSLPGTAAESPAVTLSYYWTYKVRYACTRCPPVRGPAGVFVVGCGRCCAL
jgi:hypothetical protein